MTKEDKTDRLNKKVSRSRQTEEFKRPDHPDFMDFTELQKIKFSGYRNNSLTMNCEIWMQGTCLKTITPEDLLANGNIIQESLSEIFALDNILPDTEQARTYGLYRDREANRESSGIIIPFDKHSTTVQ